jgi:Lipase (class 3)
MGDTIFYKPHLPSPSHFHRAYRSPETGLKNQWELWMNADQSTGIITIRGTVAAPESWLENFYAAMVPANGVLHLNDSTQFNYCLAKDSQATVHIGWLVGMASMAPDILQKIRRYYRNGTRQFIVCGHSQGGAIAFLLRSYLYYCQQAGTLPADIIFKTYCSAAPKPGNLFYAYDFDYITRKGWAFTVVNTADWVPQTPLSIQTLHDFPPLNPFDNVDAVLHKQSLLVRWYLSNQYHKLEHSTLKAQKRFEKSLGNKVYQQIRKYLPQYRQPVLAHSNNYQRAGTPIVLKPDEAYWRKHTNDTQNIFEHHLLEPYYELMEKW